MVHLIDKDALVAEIKRRIKECDEHLETPSFYCGMESGLRASLDSIDTLEVKEVDEQKERISECPYRQVGCTMYEGKVLECKGMCSWVADYPKLKELKAQKGEKV